MLLTNNTEYVYIFIQIKEINGYKNNNNMILYFLILKIHK